MVVEKNNAICSICERPYHKCLSCRDSMNLQPWKMFTDTAEHYKVFQAVRGLSTGVYNRDEFKSKLKNIDLSDLEDYKESVKSLIKDALKEDKPVIEEIIEEVVEEVIEPVVEEIATEELAPKKATNSRKRNYKAEEE